MAVVKSKKPVTRGNFDSFVIDLKLHEHVTMTSDVEDGIVLDIQFMGRDRDKYCLVSFSSYT